MEKNKIKVIVGLSGGVDSAIALANLIEEGYDVEAMFMRNWDSAVNNDVLGNPDLMDEVCPQEKDYQDALKVANKLGIKLHRIDFIDDYWNNVFTYFLDEYKKNRTPNPDVMCNKEIKFKVFLEQAEKLGADYIAMGHYAKVIHSDRSYLLRAADTNKDQTYFLGKLSQEQLSKALFPIGNMVKAQVRKKATDLELDSVATKRDSTGVCFIGERNFKEFLMNYLPANPGNIVSTKGEVLGRHDGTMYYTIGQRHGLGIGGPGDAWFVVGKDAQKNELIVGQGTEQELLYANRVIVTDVSTINEPFPSGSKITCKFRYRQPDTNIIATWLDETTIEVRTTEPVKAVTPGQFCVFYDGAYCLGAGTIDQVYFDDQRRKY